MAEELTSISKARAKLPRLSRAAKRRMSRYIITHEGQPQSVLIGFDEYVSMKAAVDLMQRPEVVADIEAGLKEIAEGKGLSASEMKGQVRQMARREEAAQVATELSQASGVDAGAVEAVMGSLATRIRCEVEKQGRASIPGVGEVILEGSLRQWQRRPGDLKDGRWLRLMHQHVANGLLGSGKGQRKSTEATLKRAKEPLKSETES